MSRVLGNLSRGVALVSFLVADQPQETMMLKGVLLWAIGIPLPIILLLYACGVM